MEYAVSDLAPEGRPFLIVLHYGSPTPELICAIVLKKWQAAIDPKHRWDIQTITDFIYDVRQLMFHPYSEVEEFLHAIQMTDRGPVRTFLVGSMDCSAEMAVELNRTLPTGKVAIYETEPFEDLLQQVCQHGTGPR